MSLPKLDEDSYLHKLHSTLLYHEAGKITKSIGLMYEAYLPGAAVGSLCRIETALGKGVQAEVIGFKDKSVLLMPFEEARGVNNDSLVVLEQRSATVKVGAEMLGRVLNGQGQPLDENGPIETSGAASEDRNLYQPPTSVVRRSLIAKPLDLGVRAINGLLTVGQGQRVGIFSGSGVGKSVLLGMIARNTTADINVIALVGERGREVREFIERDLGEEGLKKSVVVVATSDSSALLRVRAAYLATSVAEYFRDQGKNVLLLMDSVTRLSMAQREIGLSVGEPPTTKGYTPSVFSNMPKLMERAGTGENTGSITGLYAVLVEGDEMDDPIADAARSILDGHVVLSRTLAERNFYPAIDISQSSSRVMKSVIDQDHQAWAAQIREWIALYNQIEDLINLGAYVKGANARIDQAVEVHDRIESFLKQGTHEKASFAETTAEMLAIIRAGEAYLAALQAAQQPQEPTPAKNSGLGV